MGTCLESTIELPVGAFWHGSLKNWSLARRFAVTGGVIATIAATLAGAAISGTMARTTIDATANSTALFLDSFLSPAVHQLVLDGSGSAEALELDRLLKSSQFSERFPHVEIWLPDGRIAYSTSPELIGAHFEPPEGLVLARDGEVTARYTDLSAEEHTMRHFEKPFLEIYVPIRAFLSENVIAVAEIHEVTGPLELKLRSLRIQTWAAVVGSSLLVMLALYGIVRRASKEIESQRAALHAQLYETSRVSEQNKLLRERARRASVLVSEMNEENLRELGAELHDGPAQLIGLAALRVEHARRAGDARARETHLGEIETLLADANLKVRNLSKGLVLPALEGLPLCEVVSRAVRAHEQKTRTTVAVVCPAPGPKVAYAVSTCVYRFIQEGLNNAFRHAGGQGQGVECEWKGGVLTVSVRDQGGMIPKDRDGVMPNAGAGSREGLGLTWIRARVESLGGAMQMKQNDDGMTVSMTIATSEVRS